MPCHTSTRWSPRQHRDATTSSILSRQAVAFCVSVPLTPGFLPLVFEPARQNHSSVFWEGCRSWFVVKDCRFELTLCQFIPKRGCIFKGQAHTYTVW